MIYALYGQPESGKTTLGTLLAEHLDTPFIIDGDEFRSFFSNIDYGPEGRKKNILAANAVATYLNKKSEGKGHVIMSLVNPYEEFREELRKDNEGQVLLVLLACGRTTKKEYHVEDFETGSPDHTINTDEDVRRTWRGLKTVLKI